MNECNHTHCSNCSNIITKLKEENKSLIAYIESLTNKPWNPTDANIHVEQDINVEQLTDPPEDDAKEQSNEITSIPINNYVQHRPNKIHCQLIVNGYIRAQNLANLPPEMNLIIFTFYYVTSEFVRVFCRFRPQNTVEKNTKAHFIHKISNHNKSIQLTHPNNTSNHSSLHFDFDYVFDCDSTQTELFAHIGPNIIDYMFTGYNTSIIAYGRTGAGKTYTMEGKLGSPNRGLLPRIIDSIFERIEESDYYMEFLLQVSYVEIYLEKLRDLFRPGNTNLNICENKYGMYIENITEMYVRDAQEILDLFDMGLSNRSVALGAMNALSSRSHGIFMVKLQQHNTQTGNKRINNMKFCDLGGSEKFSKYEKERSLEERHNLSQSLDAFRNVCAQLISDKKEACLLKSGSLLTRLLSDELGGNCKTTFIVNCSSSSYNAEETINSCIFSRNVMQMQNCSKVNKL